MKSAMGERIMTVDLTPELEERLQELAAQQAKSVTNLIREILAGYLNSVPDNPTVWVQTTQRQLERVWPAEDFSGWSPPNAS